MLRGSLVSSSRIRQLRHLTRYRHKLIRRDDNRRGEFEHTSFVSDINGVSARRMLDALIAGERDVEVLADMALRTLRAKIVDLRRATTGNFTAEHADMLRVILDHIDGLDRLIHRLSEQIASLMAPFDETATHLATAHHYGRFFRSKLHPLLKRINGYLVRWARNKYRRLASFKRVKRWWDRLVNRGRGLFSQWQWTGTFEWIR